MSDLPTPETDALDCELHNLKVLSDRYSIMRDHSCRMERERDEALSQIYQAEDRAERFCQERDEARNKMADALQEVDLRTLDFERMNQECYELREELRTTVQERHDFHWELLDAIRERDEAREVLREIAEASGFDNIGNWARNKSKSALYR